MIRVGFVMNKTVQGWMGGVNYLRNLFHAIQSIPNGPIAPVLVVPPNTPHALLASFPPVDVVRTRLVERLPQAARRVATRWLGRDTAMERLLRSHGIAVLSHSDHLGAHGRLPTIGWIPDFQHLAMPEFFSPEEIAHRDRTFRQTLACSTLVVVSSQAAQRDLATFEPAAAARSRVLHFVSGYGETEDAVTRSDLQSRYQFSGPYFHLPNQFWAHKNHRLVVDALAQLKANGESALVLATGQTHAYRQAQLFGDLMLQVASNGVSDNFRVLGMLPFADVTALMRHAVGVINPSHFEGWSTSVEESKSFGTRVLLSDIAVHREQAPERALYFSPRRPEELAQAMHTALATFSPNDETHYRQRARHQRAERFEVFGGHYLKLVEEALALHASGVGAAAATQ